MKTLIALCSILSTNPAVTTHQIVDRFAEAHHYCDQKPQGKPGDIVIEWKRDKNGVCRQAGFSIVPTPLGSR